MLALKFFKEGENCFLKTQSLYEMSRGEGGHQKNGGCPKCQLGVDVIAWCSLCLQPICRSIQKSTRAHCAPMVFGRSSYQNASLQIRQGCRVKNQEPKSLPKYLLLLVETQDKEEPSPSFIIVLSTLKQEL